MKTNKLLLSLLATSITINIVTLIFNSDEKPDDSLNTATQLNSNNDNLFSQQEDLIDELTTMNPEADQSLLLKKKIAILAKQNDALQKQIDTANDKQATIVTALNTIVDKIDSQFLTPSASSINSESSSYNMDFNTISKEVVNKCMKVSTVASASVRQQQKQSRVQLLEDEVIDSAWSSEIETEIQSILSNQQLHDSELVALNCRTTICKITVQHSSIAAKKLFEAPFFSRFQPSISQYDEIIDDATRQPIGIIYLTRSSHASNWVH